MLPKSVFGGSAKINLRGKGANFRGNNTNSSVYRARFYDFYRRTFEKREPGMLKKKLPLHLLTAGCGAVGTVAQAEDSVEDPLRQEYLQESVKDKDCKARPALREPIVRSKEVKGVVFGAKCNNILVGGMSCIEKLLFNIFHEEAG